MYTYLFAGEDLELAEAELEGFLRSQNVDEEPERNGRLAFTDAEPSQLRRLGLVHEVSRVLERFEAGKDPDYRPEGSFRLRAVDVNHNDIDTKQLEADYGARLQTERNSVDLEEPENDLRLYVIDDGYVLASLEQDIPRGLYEKRSNEKRPFSSPVSLSPVLARVLVNLTGADAGSRLLDPFCGTGGILIEAGLCGIGVHGLDIQQEMVEGTRENLEEYGIINHDIKQGGIEEATELFERSFDAVVTDLPYGKASRREGEPVKDFLETVGELSSRTVFMSDQEELADLEPEFEVYVHSNLTRYIYILDQ